MRVRASITVFLILLLTCLFSGIFALLEAARLSALKSNVQMCTVQAGDAILASYDRTLWQRYHLLFWEGREGDFPVLSRAGSLQQDIIAGNWKSNGYKKNFYVLPVRLSGVQVKYYQLATDNDGAPFRIEAAERMKTTVTEYALEQLKDRMISLKNDSDAEKSAIQENALRRAAEQEKAALEILGELQSAGKAENLNRSKKENSGAKQGKAKNAVNAGPKNPIEWLKEVKKKGILAFVMPQENISSRKTDWSDSVGKRKLQKGNASNQIKEGVSEKLLFRLYLEEYFVNVTEQGENLALEYEIEYLIGGKDSDEKNLKAVIRRLLLMREAANMIYLETSPEKQKEAFAMAAAITAAVAQPEFAEPVKHGILAAWAYAEALSDVRILLHGGKVSLIKTDEQWHTQLDRLSASIQENDGKTQQKGLSYANYLQILMWSVSDKKLTYRAMDLIEKNAGVCMDKMVFQMDCTYEYEASTLFWNFVRLGNHSFAGYRFQDSAQLSYLQ